MPTRVLIVEDSPTQRLALTRLIESAPDLTVCGQAADGEEAIRLAEELRPDVISMDVLMPRLDGLNATRRIMAVCPTPIVVVSSVSASRDAMEILRAGALAAVEKPPAPTASDYAVRCAEIIRLLRLMSAVRVIRHWSPDGTRAPHPTALLSDSGTGPLRPILSSGPMLRFRPTIVGIGASAGGPGALATILSRLPADFPLPIMIVQHLSAEFVPGLAEWLDRSCPLTVRLAAAGEVPVPGTVYVAPGNTHLRLGTDRALVLDSRTGSYRHCPAVDALFESFADSYGAQAIGVVLTGMGDDGALGLRAMRNVGAHTIAQDEASCVVFGMPGAAIAQGAAEFILPLTAISGALQRLAVRGLIQER
ncbi:MAG: chemotaxis-specific protein-glutamate methyltransferase CheB [Aggregatilineales bacterium]